MKQLPRCSWLGAWRLIRGAGFTMTQRLPGRRGVRGGDKIHLLQHPEGSGSDALRRPQGGDGRRKEGSQGRGSQARVARD